MIGDDWVKFMVMDDDDVFVMMMKMNVVDIVAVSF